MLRGVIIDYGGVVSLNPTAEALARLHQLSGLDAEAFAAAWLRHRHAYDLAELSASEYWALVRGDDCDGELLGRLVAADADAWAETNDEVVEWLREVRVAGLRIGLLSNMPLEMWEAISPRQAWLDLCDEVTLSYEWRAAKPDPAIYAHCLAKLGLHPQEALFVDDRPENVDAAAALGLHAVVFTDVGRLRDELRSKLEEASPAREPEPPHA